MKKNYVYALMSAVALLGAVSLSACSSSDDVVDVNPTFDGEAVKTQFTISFPQNVAKTRQTAGTVQQTEVLADFRGIEEIVLYPFAATAVANADPIANSSTKLGDAITLTNMIKPTSSSQANYIPAGASGLTANNNSVLFNDVKIPIGTGSFLFYGKAIDNTTYTDKFYNGSLTLINTTAAAATPDAPNPANIAFDLDQVYPSTTTTASAVGEALAAYLTAIANAEHWADCADPNKSAETYYNAALGDLYTKFTSMKAGSSLTVQAAIQDLYATVKNNTDVVSSAIKTAILNSTYVDNTSNPDELSFKSNLGNSYVAGTDKTVYFPYDVNLPDGAALLGFENKTFSQKTTGGDKTGLTGKYEDYVYPASLYYYCNSGITTSTTSETSEYKSNVDPENSSSAAVSWNDILDKYDGATQVTSSTRSVAILDPIQYAVGRLDMTVNVLPAATMYDKKGEAYNASNGFTVTGVLIGGQKRVGFDFKTNTTATEKTIYDNISKSQPTASTSSLTVTASNASAVNYTLALETEANKDVYVAIEFLNNGEDFEGFDGVIPANCKFYLVGKLTPSSATSGYIADTMDQVFKQDHKTIVSFTIPQGYSNTDTSNYPSTGNTTGLGKAYNTVPDLRTPQLELGLSVDLRWESGLTFNNVPLGE